MTLIIYYLGLDWLTYSFVGTYSGTYFDSLFRDFSVTANQRFNIPFFGQLFDVSYKETPGKYILTFSHRGTNVMELVKNRNPNSSRQYSYKFTFYGAFFYIGDLSNVLLDFTKQYVRYISFIERLDIALDSNVSIPSLYEEKHTQFANHRLFKNRDVLTGFELGGRKGSKKHFIRVYDKKLDSNNKGKWHLFAHYLQHETVSRIEVEMRRLTLDAMHISPQAIIHYEEARKENFVSTPNCLEQYFASLCMNEQGTNFHALKDISFKDVQRLKTTRFTGQADEIIDQTRYVKDFITRANNLQKMHIDPIAIIRRHLPHRLLSLNQQDSSSASV